MLYHRTLNVGRVVSPTLALIVQRDANRILGYTAQQTLDYLQSLYEKKLATYPRTDSRFLTNDMEPSVYVLVLLCAGICDSNTPLSVNSGQVCNSQKVSDHHAVIPTKSAGETDLSALPAGEREILRLTAKQLLRAVSAPYHYAETVVTLDCGGKISTTKGKSVVDTGWKALR